MNALSPKAQYIPAHTTSANAFQTLSPAYSAKKGNLTPPLPLLK